MLRSLSFAALVCVSPLLATAQQTRFRAELAPFYHTLSNDYGHWSGFDARFWYRTPKFTPILSVSSQRRSEGSQKNLGLTSYIVPSDRFYTIVGVSMAPSSDVVLYPDVRADITGFLTVATGIVLNLGFTEIKFEDSDAQIGSLGAMLYRGRSISTAIGRLNRDGTSGDLSGSVLLTTQHGTEGKRWIGGGVGGGREAYQVVAATPFDVRFTSVSAFAFLQQWLLGSSGINARYDFEHKRTAYTRHGFTVGYFIDF